MIRSIHTRFLVAEGKGQIPKGSALGYTAVAALAAGTKAFYEGYHGNAAWADAAKSHRAATHETERVTGAVYESAMSAITNRNVARAMTESHTTNDFPLMLQNIQSRIIRGEYNPVQSDIASAPFVVRRTTGDFKVMQDVRNSALSEIPVRPEGTDVELTTLTQSEGGYRVANYERGIEFTWELFKNDNLSAFTNGLAQLGRAANRTRGLALFREIMDKIAQTTLSGVGGPTIARVELLIQLMAEYVIQVEGGDKPSPRNLTDIYAPINWKTLLNQTLNSQEIRPVEGSPTANPVFGTATPHFEVLMGEVLGKDWLGIDSSVPSIEFATLEGFEAGPKTYTLMPDVKEVSDEGSFKNHTLAVKVGDAFGWRIFEPSMIRRIKGA